MRNNYYDDLCLDLIRLEGEDRGEILNWWEKKKRGGGVVLIWLLGKFNF